MDQRSVYLDHSATTPLDSAVFEAMKPYFLDHFGNPSSLHRQGQHAEAAVENARLSIADLLGCSPGSIFFTACATESNNLVLQGLAAQQASAGKTYHVLTTPVEHPSVLETLQIIQARAQGMYSFLPIDHGGKIAQIEFEGLLDDEISLVSVIFGNNEVGTVNPVADLGAILAGRRALLHTDAVQTVNFLKLNVDRLGVDFLTLSPHKFYGPKGVGILYVRDPSVLKPILGGGSQESGLRPGTYNVPLIVGAARAFEIAQSMYESETARLHTLQQTLIDEVTREIPDCELTGDPLRRLPHHASFVFADIDSNELISALDLRGFACSSGSACKVGNPEPSELLIAMGYPAELASGALRVTMGRSTTAEQMAAFVAVLGDVIERLRSQDSEEG